LVDRVFKAIAEAAAKGEDVSIPGFGKFKVQDKPARTGRNPATGQAVEIAAARKVAFPPAKQLKDAVNG
jgi:DNA-binding protein HU-beta